MPLTDTRIKNTKPAAKPVTLFDGGGQYLLIQPSSARWWRYKYRFASKPKLQSLGVYPGVSLAQARVRHAEARALLTEGKDPAEARRADKRAQAHQAANSFEAVAREWHEKESPRWTPDHAARVLHSLEVDLFPVIGGRPIAEITAAEWLAEVRKVEKRGALEVASRVLQRASAVFPYGIATDRIKSNPAADLKGALKRAKVEHRAALPASELPVFLRKLDAYQGDPQTALGLNLILLTFVRTGELRGAEWSEFDMDKAEWRVPSERMKMRAPHIVPLSRQAVAVLSELKALTGTRPGWCSRARATPISP